MSPRKTHTHTHAHTYTEAWWLRWQRVCGFEYMSRIHHMKQCLLFYHIRYDYESLRYETLQFWIYVKHHLGTLASASGPGTLLTRNAVTFSP